jgi:S-adenosylmethionine hydrolase
VPASPIVFLSDFGLQDEFVGTCHGVIARITPGSQVIDLAHGVPRGDVLRGALLLRGALAYVPDRAVLLAVIDPGVGGRRRPVALDTRDGRLLVGPDNGVLSLAWRVLGGVARAVEVTSASIVLHPTSATFHGRDVFAPAAAHLAGGGDLSELGGPVDPATLIRVDPPEPRIAPGSLTAYVLAVDSFGNVQLGAAATDLDRAGLGDAAVLTVRAGAESSPAARAQTYSAVGDDELMVLVDSSGRLAVARNRGDASMHLRVAPGDWVEIGGPEL